jgi:hypothetical protein
VYLSRLLSRGGIKRSSVLASPIERGYSRRYCAGFSPACTPDLVDILFTLYMLVYITLFNHTTNQVNFQDIGSAGTFQFSKSSPFGAMGSNKTV